MPSQLAASHYCIFSITAQLPKDDISVSVTTHTREKDWGYTHNVMPSYEKWIAEWCSHLAGLPDTVMVPPEATAITTPLHAGAWQALLAEYPDKPLVTFFISGITQGFRIGFHSPPNMLKSTQRNLGGALQHLEVVDEYLAAEVAQQRLAGPFTKSTIPQAHVSRFGVIPKNHNPNKWRLITDLSHLVGHSVNDGIPKDLCTLTYITVDMAIKCILDMGPGTLLAKVDIKNAFRLLPVHPADRHMLAMNWNNQIYIDTCLPFGLCSVPKLFNILADLLSWILAVRGVSPILHYLDDFLIMGPPTSSKCLENLNIIKEVCLQLGIPLALEKLEGPSQSLTFLGIILDTEHMEARLPDAKLSRIRHQLTAWLGKKRATKRQILSLVGLLQHATKVVRPGRTFVSRMYSTAAKLKELSHYTRLSKDFWSDVHWWHVSASSWNGLSFFQGTFRANAIDWCIQTDASGSWGCGALFDKHWFQYTWSDKWSTVGIMAKELVPIVLSCAIWGPLLAKKTTVFQCDNRSLVEAINKGSSKDLMVMHLLRCLWFFTAVFDMQLIATHIAGVANEAADMLSRDQANQFLRSHPRVSPVPTGLPSPLLQIVSPAKLDWTSPAFPQLLKEALAQISAANLQEFELHTTNSY